MYTQHSEPYDECMECEMRIEIGYLYWIECLNSNMTLFYVASRERWIGFGFHFDSCFTDLTL